MIYGESRKVLSYGICADIFTRQSKHTVSNFIRFHLQNPIRLYLPHIIRAKTVRVKICGVLPWDTSKHHPIRHALKPVSARICALFCANLREPLPSFPLHSPKAPS
jgi:hypothetical protein